MMESAAQTTKPSTDNQLGRTPNDVHALILDDSAAAFGAGTTEGCVVESAPAGVGIRRGAEGAGVPASRARAVYTSREIAAAFPFNEVVPSWNVDVPRGCGFYVELRFHRADRDEWTAYYYLGSWGAVPGVEHKVVRDDRGVVHTDCFQSALLFDRMQYRVHLFGGDAGAAERGTTLRRFALAYSNTRNDAELARRVRRAVDPGPPSRWTRRLPVPFRSQKAEAAELRGSICSPTSTSMVMEYRGVREPTTTMAKIIYDPEYGIYGNWSRAVQGAYVCGVPGYIERFGDWDAVKLHIAHGQPVIASIRAAQGELRGAPYRRSGGHLLVITGFDEHGNVHVNDPAGATAEQGVVTYAREDVEAVWFGHGGVGYVLLAPEARGSGGRPQDAGAAEPSPTNAASRPAAK